MKIWVDIVIIDFGYIREVILIVFDCFNDKIGNEGKNICMYFLI